MYTRICEVIHFSQRNTNNTIYIYIYIVHSKKNLKLFWKLKNSNQFERIEKWPKTRFGPRETCRKWRLLQLLFCPLGRLDVLSWKTFSSRSKYRVLGAARTNRFTFITELHRAEHEKVQWIRSECRARFPWPMFFGHQIYIYVRRKPRLIDTLAAGLIFSLEISGARYYVLFFLFFVFRPHRNRANPKRI